jgi:hypothetical protein
MIVDKISKDIYRYKLPLSRKGRGDVGIKADRNILAFEGFLGKNIFDLIFYTRRWHTTWLSCAPGGPNGCTGLM